MNLETSRVEQNEQVKAVDFDFAFESIASNIALAIRRIVGQTESDILIGGVVTAAPGSSMNIIISEILASGLNSFALDTEQIGPIGVSASTTADRRDIVQVRGVYEGYDSKQRGFYDTDTDIVTYAFIDTKKKLAVEVSVKAGVPGSISAPTTDEGYIKIAEILIPAGSINITDGNIFNVTADISGVENNYWKTEKSRSFRVGGINDIKTLFRVQHEASGAHKDNVIGANSIKIGNAQNFLNGSIIPNGASALIGSENLPATTTIPNMIASVLAYINAEIADRKKLSEITTQVSSNMTLGSFEKNTRRFLFNSSANNITITMKAGEKIKEDASFVLFSKELAGIEKISETGWVFVSRNLVDASTVLGKIPGTRGLDYLQSGTVAQMAAKVLSDLKTVDGSGSGLDADLIDGIDSTRIVYGTTVHGTTTLLSGSSLDSITKSGFYSGSALLDAPNSGNSFIIHNQFGASDGAAVQIWSDNATLGLLYFRTKTVGTWFAWKKIWNEVNDGSGSGLDADLVRDTTPGARGLQYLAAAAVSNIAALILADLKTVDGSGSGLDADLVRDTTPGARGLQYLAAAAVSNIAALILADLKTVDGSGSGLDADLVRDTTPGARGLQYLAAAAVSNIAALILADLKTVDGSGSGLDADLLDGLDSTRFAEAQTTVITTGDVLATMTKSGMYVSTGEGVTNTPSATTYCYFTNHYDAGTGVSIAISTMTGQSFINRKTLGTWSGWAKLWTELNDGSGSGLDADLLDGQHGSYYAPKASPALTGTPTAPTPATYKNNIQIATTEFVKNQKYVTPNTYGPNTLLADATQHGKFFYGTGGGSGLYYCAQTASDTYQWIKISE